jgi:FtsP/CotA-like multicopper oxidase with cupredoxin domain
MAIIRNTLYSLLGCATFATASASQDPSCSAGSECTPFTIELTWGKTNASLALSKDAILTNGTLPGPPLKINEGDCVDFTVINNLDNFTTVHFHGLRQLETPWSDGVPGLSQKAIQPGDTYTYRWIGDEAGTYFYHAHYKGQMMDGLYGAIIIQPPDDTDRPFASINSADIEAMKSAEASLEPIIVSDWNQFTFSELFEIEKSANIDIACIDSIVLNGMGSNYCYDTAFLTANANPRTPQLLNGTSLTAKGCIPPSNPITQGNYTRTLSAIPAGAYAECTPYTGQNYTYTVDPSEGYAAMSFISTAGTALFRITIDGHKLYVYEFNGNYIVPQAADQISLDPGDRVSVMVKLDQTPASYPIRVANAGLNQVISGYGALVYSNAATALSTATPLMNIGGINTTTIVPFKPALAAPYPSLPSDTAVSPIADKTFNLDIMKLPSQPLSWSWVLNGVTPYDHIRDDQAPLLAMSPNSIPESDLILRTNHNDWVDLIILISGKGSLAQPHPIHKHANKFFVIGSGVGAFNYSTVADAQAAGLYFNLENPPYVDGFTTPPSTDPAGAWMVLRYQANTPGAWLLHCHVQTHFSGGMAVAILDAVDQWPTVPADAGEPCASGGSSSSGGKGSSGSSGSGSSSSGSGSGSGGASASGQTPSGSDGQGSGSPFDDGTTSSSSGTKSSGSAGASASTKPFEGAAASLTPSMLVGCGLGLLAFFMC